MTSWTHTGFLETTPGAEIDMNAIIEKIRWASRLSDVQEVTFDRWGGIKAAATLLLVPEGFICIDIPQTIGGLTAGNQALDWALHERKLAHGNNPILNWHASCLALVTALSARHGAAVSSEWPRH